MILHNVTVTIPGETIGNLIVSCDLKISDYEDAASHPDAMIKSIVTDIEVEEIHSVEFHVFNKVGVTMTWKFKNDRELKQRLEAAIIEETEFKNLRDLKNAS